MPFFPTPESSETAKLEHKVLDTIPYRSIWMLLTGCETPWIASPYRAQWRFYQGVLERENVLARTK